MQERGANSEAGAAGGPGADPLFLEVYKELRALAAAKMRREDAGHTLQPTALVHEAYLKLADQTRALWRDRDHFFAVAAEALRRVLIDHARRRNAQKRGAPGGRVSLDEGLDAAAAGDADLLALDEAMRGLAEVSPRQARVVELRFFGGLGAAETARVLGVSENTVHGDWRFARAWLQGRLAGESR